MQWRDSGFVCGGGAKNVGLVKELEEMIGAVVVPGEMDPRLVPAIGAALIAREENASSNVKSDIDIGLSKNKMN